MPALRQGDRRERAPGSTGALRAANQKRVLSVLRQIRVPGEDDVTQAELARLTGLAPATVSNIVRELAAAGLLDVSPGSGRRGAVVRLAHSAGLVVGIDVGHSHVAVAIGDLRGELVIETRRPLDPSTGYDAGLDFAAELAERMVELHEGPGAEIRTVALGLPAPITDDVVRSSAILPGWVGIDARKAASARFGVPAHVENDANLGALAEHRYGVARGLGTSVFVKISSGVGAGIIIDDRLFHGSAGTAGELGHLTLDDQGPVCRCGSRGCLEAYVSTETVLAMMAGQLPGASLDDVLAAAREGNMAALRTLEDAGLHLGWGLASVVNLLNPDVVVVGGDLARAGDLLLESVRIGMRRHALDAVAATPVLPSALRERASLVGAVLLAAERTELLPAMD